MVNGPDGKPRLTWAPRVLRRSQYPELFKAIAKAFGRKGDHPFVLPDLRKVDAPKNQEDASK